MTRSWKRWGLLGLFLTLGLIYSPSLQFQRFVYDGGRLLKRQPVVKGPWSLHRILTTDYWGRPRHKSIGSYRPFAVADLWLEYHLFGPNPTPFAITQILWMLGVCLGVVAFARLLSFSMLVAWMAGLLFAVHPVHTEIVASIAGRADLLMAFLFLLSLWLHRSTHPLAGPFNLLIVFLGLCSKELFVIFPAAAMLLDLHLPIKTETSASTPLAPTKNPSTTERATSTETLSTVDETSPSQKEPRPTYDAASQPKMANDQDETPPSQKERQPTLLYTLKHLPWLQYTLYGIVTVLFLWMRYRMLGSFFTKFPHGSHDNPLMAASWGTKLLNAPMLLWRYFELLVMPISLSPDRTYNAVPLLTSPLTWRFGAGLTLLFGLAFLWFQSSSRTRLLIALGFLAYLPISNTVVTGPIIMADRWLFLVSVPFCIGLAASLRFFLQNYEKVRTLWVTLYVVIVLSWSAITYDYTSQWSSHLTLFAYASQNTPNSVKARYIYASELLRRRKPKQAMAEFQAALRIKPTFTLAHFGIAKAHEQMGQLKQAEQTLRDEVLRLGKRSPNARIRLILFLRRQRRFKEAQHINMTIQQDFPHWLRMMQQKYKRGSRISR